MRDPHRIIAIETTLIKFINRRSEVALHAVRNLLVRNTRLLTTKGAIKQFDIAFPGAGPVKITRAQLTAMIRREMRARLGNKIVKETVRKSMARGYTAGLRQGARIISKASGADVASTIMTSDRRMIRALSKGMWNRLDALDTYITSELQYLVQEGMIKGWGTRADVKTIADKIVSKHLKMMNPKIARIVRTEMIRAANFGILSVASRNGSHFYFWTSTFTEVTCEVCMGLDGRIFKIGQGLMPPIHPNCRCFVVPIVEDTEYTLEGFGVVDVSKIDTSPMTPARRDKYLAEVAGVGKLRIKRWRDTGVLPPPIAVGG